MTTTGFTSGMALGTVAELAAQQRMDSICRELATEGVWAETACSEIRARGRLRKELPGACRRLA